MVQAIADLLFEAKMLKDIPRSGYPYLGVGRESVAAHIFMTSFIAHVLSMLEPSADALKLLQMCLLHDLPEARTGDLNAVQKKYVSADEDRAVADLTQKLPFGGEIRALLEEFRAGRSLEAKLAHDADQLSFLLDLKSLKDIGHATPEKWIAHVRARVQTEAGQQLVCWILHTEWDHWWLKDF
ncbi:MAG: HD domain-containing protein [Desulfobacterales bacterium]|jgi:putative hydrolase of HD superfamily|nr:HD domain-containing protein [Desulfobacterales bacterium]